jgi:hypothetical protein
VAKRGLFAAGSNLLFAARITTNPHPTLVGLSLRTLWFDFQNDFLCVSVPLWQKNLAAENVLNTPVSGALNRL